VILRPRIVLDPAHHGLDLRPLVAAAQESLAIIQHAYEVELAVGDLQIMPLQTKLTDDIWPEAAASAWGVIEPLLPQRERGIDYLVWASGLAPGANSAPGMALIYLENLTREGSDRKRAWLPWHECLHLWGLGHAGPLYSYSYGQRTDTVYSSWQRFSTDEARVFDWEMDLLRDNHVVTQREEPTVPAEIPLDLVTPHDVLWVPAHSDNYSHRRDVDWLALVIHTPEEDADDFEGTPAWFQNPAAGASTHFYVDSDGDVYQMVPLSEGSYGQGVRQFNRVWKGAQGQVAPWLPTTSGVLHNYNWHCLGIEVEGRAASIPPRGHSNAQWTSLVTLCRYLCERYRISINRDHIVGHYEIANHKSDPGNLDLEALVDAVHPTGLPNSHTVVVPKGLDELIVRFE
jgi:hypothetical protein